MFLTKAIAITTFASKFFLYYLCLKRDSSNYPWISRQNLSRSLPWGCTPEVLWENKGSNVMSGLSLKCIVEIQIFFHGKSQKCMLYNTKRNWHLFLKFIILSKYLYWKVTLFWQVWRHLVFKIFSLWFSSRHEKRISWHLLWDCFMPFL